MTILEPIINEVSEQFGLRGKAGPLMTAQLTLISNERTGGLQGFLDQFRRAGLGEIVSSWVSRGSNTPITTEQLERAIGSDTINRISSNVGVARAAAASAFAYMIPRVVDLLTPEGVIPSRLPAWVNSYLSGAPARPRSGPRRSGRRASLFGGTIPADRPSSGCCRFWRCRCSVF